MKSLKLFLLFLSVAWISSATWAQELIQYPAASLQLEMKGLGGKNGASVAYNPDNDLYYAVIAGNSTYPMETFSGSGKNLYSAEAYNDMRGLWWNPKDKALEGNCYADGGIISVGLMPNGWAGAGNKVIFAGSSHQPSEQAVGTFDPKKKEILYYNEGSIFGYARKDGAITSTYFFLSLPVDVTDINWTTLIFTGVKGKELGVLDYQLKKIYLFNRKDGTHAGTVNLPASVTTYDVFNFSYANGYVFLFDQEARKWVGYKIFEF